MLSHWSNHWSNYWSNYWSNHCSNQWSNHWSSHWSNHWSNWIADPRRDALPLVERNCDHASRFVVSDILKVGGEGGGEG